ncbi:MAG: hypothetical protein NZ602_08805 [Thermoguttaceae bacterium]|nr:hypothetical protein [Thermoguttaceae bacterium]MDW8038919.1 hypothetical protein [Thermoguttaceae bacterium]
MDRNWKIPRKTLKSHFVCSFQNITVGWAMGVGLPSRRKTCWCHLLPDIPSQATAQDRRSNLRCQHRFGGSVWNIFRL